MYRVYTSLNSIPIATYDKIQNTGNVRLLAAFWLPNRLLMYIWERLTTQYIKEIGLGESYRNYLEGMRQYAVYLSKAFYKKHYKVNAQIAKTQAEMHLKGLGGNQDIYTTCAQLSHAQGYHIDPSKISVREFYAILKANEARVQAHNRMIEKQNGRK